MSEVATSIFNKNSLFYGSIFQTASKGPDCVDQKGEDAPDEVSKPDEAVREK